MALGAPALEAGSRRSAAGWFLLVALGCGLAAATLAVRSVSAARREVDVVVARREVAPLTAIAGADIAVSAVPVAAVPPDALRSAVGLVGRFTRLGLAPGEVVTPEALGAPAGGTSAADVRLAALAAACGSAASGAAPPAKAAGPACADVVAEAVPLDADQGFSIVQPGDRVDIAAAYGLSAGTVAQVVVADAPVLDKLGGTAGPQPGLGAAAGATSGWLVLGLSPADALRVQLAEASGKIAVLVRPLGAAPEDPALTAQVLDLTALAGGEGGSPGGLPQDAGTLAPPP